MNTQRAFTRICCLCNKIKSASGWVEQGDADASTLSHGYCPRCYLKVIERIKSRRPIRVIMHGEAKNKPALP